MSSSYYGITLLDDLHNYFPDILYGARGRFRNVDDLLDYIRTQTRERFDLFSNARNNVLRSVNTAPLRQAAPLTNNNILEIIYNSNEDFIDPPNSPPNDLIGSLANIVNLLYPTANNNRNVLEQIPGRTSLEPVVVRPTQEQITNATSIVELSNNTEVCAICQESMIDGIIRRINHCRHTFHDVCINRNFQRNVRCPICRFDIRNTV